MTPERLVPDVRAALAHAEGQLKALLARPAEALDYLSTFEAFDALARTVTDPWALVTNLESVDNTPAFREAFKQVQPEVTRFLSSLPLNAGLWRQLKTVGEGAEVKALSPTRQRHVEEVMADFREAGADLEETAKARLLAIDEELAKITSEFSDHYMDSLNAFEMLVEDPSELAGLPESALAAARASAQEKGYGTEDKPVWRFTLQAPSYVPFMRYADSRARRQQLYEAYYAVATREPYDNGPLIWRILGLRHEKAQLLGKRDFAEVVLARRMAGSGDTALKFEEDIRDRIQRAFAEECRELVAFKEEAGDAAPLEAWDIAYWAEKMRRARFAFDEEALRPYFSVDKVIAGLFALTEELFGVRVVELKGDAKPPVWHSEVAVYDIFDAGSERHCGRFYTDWHPRETKQSGAWMAPLRTGDGKAPSLATMTGNLTRPVGSKPALLLHSEVETIFHEFGHLLHQLLTEVEVASLGGASVAWDFVELPSQIMENWCWERVSLDRFARHFETDEPIPEDLFAAMQKTRRFRTANHLMRQITFGRSDLLLHRNTAELLEKEVDLDAWWREVNAETLVPTASPAKSTLCTFGHLFGDAVGYAAGYYSYMWADVLASDAFSRFQADGVMNAGTGRAFRDAILARGNSRPPQELFRAFMGRDPDPEALLRAYGLA